MKVKINYRLGALELLRYMEADSDTKKVAQRAFRLTMTYSTSPEFRRLYEPEEDTIANQARAYAHLIKKGSDYYKAEYYRMGVSPGEDLEATVNGSCAAFIMAHVSLASTTHINVNGKGSLMREYIAERSALDGLDAGEVGEDMMKSKTAEYRQELENILGLSNLPTVTKGFVYSGVSFGQHGKNPFSRN